jgi:hypothetical protein
MKVPDPDDTPHAAFITSEGWARLGALGKATPKPLATGVGLQPVAPTRDGCSIFGLSMTYRVFAVLPIHVSCCKCYIIAFWGG